MKNDNAESRRKLLKAIAAGSGAILAGKNLPENWARPVVDAVSLPAHAATSVQCCVIEALIDGRSQLVIRGDTVYWDHFEFSAPGLQQGTDLPTILCGTDWYPVWPGGVNVDCSNCTSQPVSGLVPTLGSIDQTVTMDVLQARESVAIVQQPDSGNGYTLIVEFNDNITSGSEIYRIQLCYL